MFSYCNRQTDQNLSDPMYKYTMNEFKQRNPFICNGTFQYQKSNKGVPTSLIDINSQLRGQGSAFQDHCNGGVNDIQFSTMRPMPSIEKSNPPCMNIISYKHDTSTNTNNCGLNRSRPTYGHPDLNYSASERF